MLRISLLVSLFCVLLAIADAPAPVLPRGRWSQDIHRLYLSFDLPLCGTEAVTKDIARFQTDRMEVSCCAHLPKNETDDEEEEEEDEDEVDEYEVRALKEPPKDLNRCHLIDFQLREDIVPRKAKCKKVGKTKIDCELPKTYQHYFDRLAFNERKWSKVIPRDWRPRKYRDREKYEGIHAGADEGEKVSLDPTVKKRMQKAGISIFADHTKLKNWITRTNETLASVALVEYPWCQQCKFARTQFIRAAEMLVGRQTEGKFQFAYIDGREVPAARRLFDAQCGVCKMHLIFDAKAAPIPLEVDGSTTANLEHLTKAILANNRIARLDEKQTLTKWIAGVRERFGDFVSSSTPVPIPGNDRSLRDVAVHLKVQSLRSPAFQSFIGVLRQSKYDALEAAITIDPSMNLKDEGLDAFPLQVRSDEPQKYTLNTTKLKTVEEMENFLARSRLPPLFPRAFSWDILPWIDEMKIPAGIIVTRTSSMKTLSKAMHDYGKMRQTKWIQDGKSFVLLVANAENTLLHEHLGIRQDNYSDHIGFRHNENYYRCPSEKFDLVSRENFDSCFRDLMTDRLASLVRCVNYCESEEPIPIRGVDEVTALHAFQVRRATFGGMLMNDGHGWPVSLLGHRHGVTPIEPDEFETFTNTSTLFYKHVENKKQAPLFSIFDIDANGFDRKLFPQWSPSMNKTKIYSVRGEEIQSYEGDTSAIHQFVRYVNDMMPDPIQFSEDDLADMLMDEGMSRRKDIQATVKAEKRLAWERNIELSAVNRDSVAKHDKVVRFVKSQGQQGSSISDQMWLDDEEAYFNQTAVVTIQFSAYDQYGELITQTQGKRDYTLGVDNIPFCWELGIRNMTLHEKSWLQCDQSLTYNSREGPGKRQPGTPSGTVWFDMELIAWHTDEHKKQLYDEYEDSGTETADAMHDDL